jgi:hypothetical protein
VTFFDELGLRAALELEKNLGPFLALASYKRLFPAPPLVRIQATFGALRCARALDDMVECASLLHLWREIATGAPFPNVIAFAADLAAQGKRDLALRIADAELARHAGARAAYLVARLSAEAGADAWEAALVLAERDRDRAVRAASIAALGRCAMNPTSFAMDRLVTLASSVDLSEVAPRDALAVIETRLRSKSRFARAAALSALGSLAESEPAFRDDVFAVLAAHVDRSGARLDPIEFDRVRAVMKHVSDPGTRETALRRVALIESVRANDAAPFFEAARALDGDLVLLAERAQRIASRAASEPSTAEGPLLLFRLSLDVVEMFRVHHDRPSSIAESLSRILELVDRGARAPSLLWVAVRLGLTSAAQEVKRTSADLAERLLSRNVPQPPRMTYLELGLMLERAGRPEVALSAIETACHFREAEGLRLLASFRQREAYSALGRGDRGRALDLLKESRRLFHEASPIAPR